MILKIVLSDNIFFVETRNKLPLKRFIITRLDPTKMSGTGFETKSKEILKHRDAKQLA